MFEWLFGRKNPESLPDLTAIPGKEVPQMCRVTDSDIPSRVQELKDSLSSEASEKLFPIRSRLADLVITSQIEAQEQLNDTNVSRRRVWGDQVATIPIIEGSDEEVFCALLDCVVADYAENGVTSLYVEEVAAPATEEEAGQMQRVRQQMRPDLDPGMRDYYEKKMMKHIRKKKGSSQEKKPTRIREINVKLHFRQTFGPHRIIRVSDNTYYFLACSVR